MSACPYPTCSLLVPKASRRENPIPWYWNYRWLFAALWALETELRPSFRAASALNTTESSLLVLLKHIFQT